MINVWQVSYVWPGLDLGDPYFSSLSPATITQTLIACNYQLTYPENILVEPIFLGYCKVVADGATSGVYIFKVENYLGVPVDLTILLTYIHIWNC